MKCLSINEPWSGMILEGKKTIEKWFRVWRRLWKAKDARPLIVYLLHDDPDPVIVRVDSGDLNVLLNERRDFQQYAKRSFG